MGSASPATPMRAAAVALLAAALGCKSAPTGPPRLCLNIEATSTLNLHDGEPHAVVLYLYPLDNATAFQETDASELLGSATTLVGMTGRRWDRTIIPGEARAVQEHLPERTQFVGLVADFYDGPRKELVRPRCEKDEKKQRRLLLLADELRVE